MSDANEQKSSHHKHRKHGKIIVATGLVAATLGLGATIAIASSDGVGAFRSHSRTSGLRALPAW